jgi:hypothetical protein
MNRLARLAASLAVAVAAMAGSLMSAPAVAQGAPGVLKIGSSWVATLRNGDRLNGRDWTAQDRIDHVHDYIAKHLGGQRAKVSSRKIGERTHLYVNGDFVLAVTPEDAKVNGYKNTEKLAAVWSPRFTTALQEVGARSPR